MPKKKIVIFANGRMKNSEKAHRIAAEADYIICADGGAVHCDRVGFFPDLLVGDFDSIPKKLRRKLEKKQVEIEQHPVHKDCTDLELALHHVTNLKKKKDKRTTVHILGALGGRWDMSLATVLLPLAADNQQLEIFLHGDKEMLSVFSPGRHTLHGTPGQRVSFLPISGTVEGLSLAGFTYSAKDISLEPGSSRGVSNCLEEKTCLIQFEQGKLLMILEER